MLSYLGNIIPLCGLYLIVLPIQNCDCINGGTENSDGRAVLVLLSVTDDSGVCAARMHQRVSTILSLACVLT